jgi:hypothetical protein
MSENRLIAIAATRRCFWPTQNNQRNNKTEKQPGGCHNKKLVDNGSGPSVIATTRRTQRPIQNRKQKINMASESTNGKLVDNGSGPSVIVTTGRTPRPIRNRKLKINAMDNGQISHKSEPSLVRTGARIQMGNA